MARTSVADNFPVPPLFAWAELEVPICTAKECGQEAPGLRLVCVPAKGGFRWEVWEGQYHLTYVTSAWDSSIPNAVLRDDYNTLDRHFGSMAEVQSDPHLKQLSLRLADRRHVWVGDLVMMKYLTVFDLVDRNMATFERLLDLLEIYNLKLNMRAPRWKAQRRDGLLCKQW